MKSVTIMLLAATCLGADASRRAAGEEVLVGPRKDPRIEAMLSEVAPGRIEATIRRLVDFGTRHTLSDPDHPTRGIGAARRWLKRELDGIAADSGGRLHVEEDAFVQPAGGRVTRPTEIVNVVAILPGESVEAGGRWMVVSGHYDSIPRPLSDATADAPGANDDASGTAVVLELARVMARQRFDATLVFLAVAGEEQGLLGSRHWADRAKAEGRRIEAFLTNDIVGNTQGGNGARDNRRIRVFSEGVASNENEAQARRRRSIGGENDGPSRQLARYIRDAAGRYMPDFEVTLVFRRDRYGRGGDHIPFNEHGYPAVRLTEPNEDFARQHERVERREGVDYGDVIGGVDFAYVAQVARVNLCTLASLARAPAPPEDVRFATSRQSYDARLQWRRGAEADLAGYRAVWRATHQPFWDHALDLGDVTDARLIGLSKDDLFFAVQAVDNEGHASLPAVPR
jgi:hypothetical protein